MKKAMGTNETVGEKTGAGKKKLKLNKDTVKDLGVKNGAADAVKGAAAESTLRDSCTNTGEKCTWKVSGPRLARGRRAAPAHGPNQGWVSGSTASRAATCLGSMGGQSQVLIGGRTMSQRKASKTNSKSGRKKLTLSKETLKDLTAKAGRANELQVKGGNRIVCTYWGSGCAD
jgi:hypothetical protein